MSGGKVNDKKQAPSSLPPHSMFLAAVTAMGQVRLHKVNWESQPPPERASGLGNLTRVGATPGLGARDAHTGNKL